MYGGRGTVFVTENPVFQRKIASMRLLRPIISRISAETEEEGSGREFCFLVHQLARIIFDSLNFPGISPENCLSIC